MERAIINFTISITFSIFDIFLWDGKGAFLIAGYNTMPDSEKAKYNEIALCKFIGENYVWY